MTEDEGRSPGRTRGRDEEIDTQVEGLAQRIAEVVNTAEPEYRDALREYAVDLLKVETETVVPGTAPEAARSRASGHPLGLALLIGAMALPMLLLFPFVGITLAAVAAVLGIVGLVSMVVRR